MTKQYKSIKKEVPQLVGVYSGKTVTIKASGKERVVLNVVLKDDAGATQMLDIWPSPKQLTNLSETTGISEGALLQAKNLEIKKPCFVVMDTLSTGNADDEILVSFIWSAESKDGLKGFLDDAAKEEADQNEEAERAAFLARFG